MDRLAMKRSRLFSEAKEEDQADEVEEVEEVEEDEEEDLEEDDEEESQQESMVSSGYQVPHENQHNDTQKEGQEQEQEQEQEHEQDTRNGERNVKWKKKNHHKMLEETSEGLEGSQESEGLLDVNVVGIRGLKNKRKEVVVKSLMLTVVLLLLMFIDSSHAKNESLGSEKLRAHSIISERDQMRRTIQNLRYTKNDSTVSSSSSSPIGEEENDADDGGGENKSIKESDDSLFGQQDHEVNASYTGTVTHCSKEEKESRPVLRRKNIYLEPKFIIMGAQKGGTTALSRNLNLHPKVFTPATEIHFFDGHLEEGLGWYKQQFLFQGRHSPRKSRMGEKTPHYMYDKDVPKKIARMFPRMKLIIVLRDPVDRAWSAYRMTKLWGSETRSFDESVRVEIKQLCHALPKLCTINTANANISMNGLGLIGPDEGELGVEENGNSSRQPNLTLTSLRDETSGPTAPPVRQKRKTQLSDEELDALEDKRFRNLALEWEKIYRQEQNFTNDAKYMHSYLGRGLYAWQLGNIRRWFPQCQMLVLVSEQMRSHFKKEFNKVIDFLGERKVKHIQVRNFNEASALQNEVFKPETQKLLREFYRLPNELLFRMLGRPIKEWNTDIIKL